MLEFKYVYSVITPCSSTGQDIIPSALTATVTATDVDSVEGCGANHRGRRLLLLTTAVGEGTFSSTMVEHQ
jgi:hypothetical protein